MAGDPKKIQIDLAAKDKASDVIDDVADAAEDLEKIKPEVTVTADTGTADADLKATADAADALARKDAALVITAKIDQAKGELRELERALKSVDDTSATTGKAIGDDIDGGASHASGAVHSMAGNVIGDSAAMATGFGPLGEAIGQITEGVLGGEVAFKQLLSAGLGMAGIALVAKTVTDALAETKAVDAFNKKKVEDFTKALREGKTMIESLNEELESTGKIEFVDQVSGATKDLVGTLADAGITWDVFSSKIAGGKQAFSDWVIASGAAIGAGDTLNAVITAGNQFVDDRIKAEKAWTDQQFVMGTTLSETERETRKLTAAVDAGTDSIDHTAKAADNAAQGVKGFRIETAKANTAYSALTGKLDEEEGWATVLANIEEYNKKTDHSEQETRDQIRAIADYVNETDTIPASKKTEILATLKQGGEGSVEAAQAELDALTATRDIRLNIILAGSKDIIQNLGAAGPTGIGLPTMAAPVTINLPRGARWSDIQRAVGTGTRRAGRRYGQPVGRR